LNRLSKDRGYMEYSSQDLHPEGGLFSFSHRAEHVLRERVSNASVIKAPCTTLLCSAAKGGNMAKPGANEKGIILDFEKQMRKSNMYLNGTPERKDKEKGEKVIFQESVTKT
jgi:hypothetical protein